MKIKLILIRFVLLMIISIGFFLLQLFFYEPAQAAKTLFLDARVTPQRVKPGIPATVSVLVYDLNKNPVRNATVKITAAAGHFQENSNKAIIGTTDRNGNYRARWIGQRYGAIGSIDIDVNASKKGYNSFFKRTYVIKEPAPSRSDDTQSSGDRSNLPLETSRMGELEWHIDRNGLDYKSIELAPNDPPYVCRDECAKDPKCRAWTFNMKGSRPRCWLKHSIPQARQDKKCISGIKYN